MAKRKGKLDATEVRSAATGRWTEILARLGGIDEAILDGQHHPCPKCGGTDRFRLIDKDAGALLCGQCFNSGNGDGFAALMWLLGDKFPDVLAKVADYLGIAPVEVNDPAKDLAWMRWSGTLAKFFINAKKGVSEAAILAAGGRMARYKHFTVIAFPIIGDTLDVENPVGWVIVNAQGGTLPKWDKNGDVVGHVKTKITYGSKSGFIGLSAVERLKTQGMVEVVWKTEGLSDMLATLAAVPASLADRHIVVTNSCGASEKAAVKWMASTLAQVPVVNILHDADEPGQTGAKLWGQEVAAQGGNPRHIELPYPIEPNHGKDVRDWLNEGNAYTDLAALSERSAPITIAKTAGGEVDYSKATFPVQERILKKLQIEVLYETEEGRIRIFSWLLRKSSWINSGNVDRLKKERFVQICGPPAMEHISSDPDGENSWSIADVREAIALMASARREEHNERGVGVWQGRDETGYETNSILLVGDTEAAKWNGADELSRVVSPRSDGLVLDFGSNNRDWFEFDELARYTKDSRDPGWCNDVLDQATELFSRWRWRLPDNDPVLVSGLCLATWVQTLWTWRPLVAVIGESNSGKSLFFEALGGSEWRKGLFGQLAFKQAKSTEAGIRQGIHNTARVVLCDEFEKSKERDKVLEMLRASTRGESISRGTSDQRGRTFTLRHIGWMAAIEAGLQRQPDINRFVQLELKRAEGSKQGQLTLPENGALYRLGQKMLAIAVTHAIEAKALAIRLKKTQFAKIDARTVEVYAVPAAILARAFGNNDDEAALLLGRLLRSVESESQGSTDHDDLLEDILGALVNCGVKDGQITVGQIIDSDSMWHEHAQRLEAQGISIVAAEGGGRRLIVAHREVASKLLRGSQWQGQRIDQILLRIVGAARVRHRMGGKNPRVISVPIE